MCWTMGVSAAMVALGGASTVVSARRKDPLAIPVTLGYFTLMEALQVAGYAVIDQCGTPVNESVTMLSVLHIVFQPLFINAFAMALVAKPVSNAMKVLVFSLCAASSVLMLLQLYPFEWAGTCAPGSQLCAERLCTVSGDWHQAWDVPYNGMLVSLEGWTGTHWGFPSYMLVAFALPLIYGAWRLVIFHLAAGPIAASLLTDNPNEVPAIWCLFSIVIVLVALSPLVRRSVTGATPQPG
ncbi:DUF5765 domain-containing protein [Pararhodobacter sp. CCB-MM2]|uniref:DUF5765 domain-containing protein n=1 Tax=Pararhodobacter sp. CCB-MM2 TaxID=1786003 RepID=UPI00082CF4FE|nr:DUF5765 domain-containing protein [Pararhodobacter sp. CCB-MM2]MCA2010378.1 DUF5765 domain-containing protein [Cereibacter sphaeroides]